MQRLRQNVCGKERQNNGSKNGSWDRIPVQMDMDVRLDHLGSDPGPDGHGRNPGGWFLVVETITRGRECRFQVGFFASEDHYPVSASRETSRLSLLVRTTTKTTTMRVRCT